MSAPINRREFLAQSAGAALALGASGPAGSAESLPAKAETTVALPPLPGSPSLNPKAN